VSDFDLYAYLKNPKVAQISIPVSTRKTLKRDCVLQVTTAPHLEARFLPDQLPPERDIDVKGHCLVSLDTGSLTIVLKTSIAKITDRRKFELINIEAVDHTQKRSFFRIDAQVPVDAKNIPARDEYSLEGETINISGNGALIAFPEPLAIDKKLRLLISIPDPEKRTIECTGKVVRCDALAEGGYRTAFYFHTIEEEDQDRIIGFCMAQQRKQLQLKVLVLGPA
jgi:hypothetical protein